MVNSLYTLENQSKSEFEAIPCILMNTSLFCFQLIRNLTVSVIQMHYIAIIIIFMNIITNICKIIDLMISNEHLKMY